MQFKIPQDVEKEDKLLFFLSLRQLFILMGGGGIAYLIYVGSIGKIQPTFFMIPIVIVLLITVLLAFFKMENIDFIRLVLLILEGIINPQRRLWISTNSSWLTHLDRMEAMSDVEKEQTKKAEAEKNNARSISLNEISDIAKIVNISENFTNDEKAEHTVGADNDLDNLSDTNTSQSQPPTSSS